MKLINLFIFLLFVSSVSFAQDTEESSSRVAAYTDIRDYFYAFSNGAPRQLESQRVKDFTFGGDVIAYVNSASNLIVWENNEKTNLGDITNTQYDVTNSLMYYKRDMVLAAWENNHLTHLSYFLRDYKVNDEMIAFRDQNIDMLKVYYKGKVMEVEYTLTGELGNFKVGKNSVAYINGSNYFKYYVDGALYELDNFPPEDFDAGKNIVAYTAAASHIFQVFYKGKIAVLEDIPPKNFQCGDELVAYVSDEGHFKVYSNGKLIKVESFPPDYYKVLDETVLFFANNQLQVIRNGVRHVLTNFPPATYQLNQNCVAWKDQQGRLFMFNGNETDEVTTELVTGFKLNKDLLSYRLPDKSYRIYYRGKVY